MEIDQQGGSSPARFYCTSRGCGHFYSSKERLDAHMKSHNMSNLPIDTFVCPTGCGAKFFRRSDLQSHFVKHHPNDIKNFPEVMRNPASQSNQLKTFPGPRVPQASSKLSSSNMSALYSMYQQQQYQQQQQQQSQLSSSPVKDDDAMLLLAMKDASANSSAMHSPSPNPFSTPFSAFGVPMYGQPMPFHPIGYSFQPMMAPAARFQEPSRHVQALPPVPLFNQPPPMSMQSMNAASPQFSQLMGGWGQQQSNTGPQSGDRMED